MVIAILLALTSTLTLAQGAPLTKPLQDRERAALFPSALMLNQGRDVAEISCANCHGMDGVSDAEGKPHLAGQRAVYLFRAERAYHTDARNDENKKHKGFLTDEALLAVAAYYSSLTPVAKSAIQNTTEQDEITEEDPFLGIRGAMKKCVKCHDESGNSDGSGMPSLTAD